MTADMLPGVLSLPRDWGCDAPGANINALMDDQQRDPLSGSAVLGGVAISMQAAVV